MALQGNGYARVVLAQELAAEGYQENAIDELYQLEPSARPYGLLARLLSGQGRLDELEDLAGEDIPARYALMGRLIDRGDLARVQYMAEFGDPVAWYSMVRYMAEHGREEEALEALRKRSREGDLGAQTKLAGLLAMLERTDELADLASAGDISAFLALKGAPLWFS